MEHWVHRHLVPTACLARQSALLFVPQSVKPVRLDWSQARAVSMERPLRGRHGGHELFTDTIINKRSCIPPRVNQQNLVNFAEQHQLTDNAVCQEGIDLV